MDIKKINKWKNKILMKPVSEINSNRIYNISLFCACLVVSRHIYPHPVDGVSLYLSKIFSDGIACISVPIFFGISGYLIAPRIDDGNYKYEVKKRIKTILLPYLIWNFFYSLISNLEKIIYGLKNTFLKKEIIYLKDYFYLIINLDSISFPKMIVKFLGVNLTEMPLLPPLWYLRNLFILVLISPLILCIVKKIKLYIILLYLLLNILLNYFLIITEVHPIIQKRIICFFSNGFSLLGLTCFAIGILFRLKEYPFLNHKYISLFCLFFGCIIILKGCIFSNNGFFYISMMIICFTNFLWNYIPTIPLPSILRRSSFPIYLMHPIYQSFYTLLQSFPRYIPSTNSITGFFIDWFMPIILSIICSLFLHKTMPRFSNVIYGGR